MDGLKQLISKEQYEEAWRQLLDAGKTVTDYPGYLALCRWHRRLEENAPRTDGGGEKGGLCGRGLLARGRGWRLRRGQRSRHRQAAPVIVGQGEMRL